MCRELKEVCEFIHEHESSHDIMDCYEDYLDQEIDAHTLIEICQDRLEDAKEDFMNSHPVIQGLYAKHMRWLGLGK